MSYLTCDCMKNNKKSEIFAKFICPYQYICTRKNSLPRENGVRAKKINELWVWCNLVWNTPDKIRMFSSKNKLNIAVYGDLH